MLNRASATISVLALVAVASAAAASAQTSGNAPADRYFGRLKLSYLGINNTFQDATIRAGEYSIDPDIANKVDFAIEALNDWQNAFPKDSHLPRSYFLGQVALKKIWIKKYQDKAWAYMQRLVTAYPTTYFGKTVKSELAKGYTQHYFADPVRCEAERTPAPATGAPVNNGKYKIQVHPAPCTPATAAPAPEPSAKQPALESTPWTLVELDGNAVSTPPDGAAPSLRFNATEKRVAGSTGCNNLTGTYTAESGF